LRLFVAVRPPPEVIDAIAALPRPERHGIRWSRADQWHVTLRFLGDVDDAQPVVDALASGLAGTPAASVHLGPATARLGRGVLMIPVEGLEGVAAAVLDATREVVPVPEGAFGFRGHLTLARCPRSVPRWALGAAIEARWTATEVELVSSRLGGGPPVHDVVARFDLD
jgi:2'-5' RNA ligase